MTPSVLREDSQRLADSQIASQRIADFPLLAGIVGAAPGSIEDKYNKNMSKFRIAVEWSFGKVSKYFAYVDFEKKPKALTGARGEVLPDRSPPDQLPFLPLRKPD